MQELITSDDPIGHWKLTKIAIEDMTGIPYENIELAEVFLIMYNNDYLIASGMGLYLPGWICNIAPSNSRVFQ